MMDKIALSEILFFIFTVVLTAFNIKKSKNRRKTIRDRVQREFDEEVELSSEELESRLGESELMYEDLEQTHWVTVGILLSFCSYLYWHVWYVSIAIGVCVVFVGWKYIAIRPFTTGIVDHRE